MSQPEHLVADTVAQAFEQDPSLDIPRAMAQRVIGQLQSLEPLLSSRSSLWAPQCSLNDASYVGVVYKEDDLARSLRFGKKDASDFLVEWGAAYRTDRLTDRHAFLRLQSTQPTETYEIARSTASYRVYPVFRPARELEVRYNGDVNDYAAAPIWGHKIMTSQNGDTWVDNQSAPADDGESKAEKLSRAQSVFVEMAYSLSQRLSAMEIFAAEIELLNDKPISDDRRINLLPRDTVPRAALSALDERVPVLVGPSDSYKYDRSRKTTLPQILDMKKYRLGSAARDRTEAYLERVTPVSYLVNANADLLVGNWLK